jgi:hypothetical protein
VDHRAAGHRCQRAVCVYGASASAAAALMLPVREPAMFKCSVGFSGRYDLVSKCDQEGIRAIRGNQLLKTMGEDRSMLAASSCPALSRSRFRSSWCMAPDKIHHARPG